VLATVRRVARAIGVEHLLSDVNPAPVLKGDTLR
jgi:hypothetical protein